jgi:hypothetical protein
MNKRFDRLPQAMKDAMAGLEELNGTPENMNLQVLLGVANTAAMKRYKVNSHRYGEVPIQEFFLAIAPSGGLKTTLVKAVTEGIVEYEQYMREQLQDENLRYAMDEKIFKNKEKDYIAQKQRDENIDIERPKTPKPVETCNYLIAKGTVNGITKPLISQPFISLMSSEAGEFFNGHSFQGGKDISKAVEMSAHLTTMWDGGGIEKNTGEQSYKLENRAVNMLFLLQAKTIQHILNNPMYSEQGFIHRILITQSPRFEKPFWDDSSEGLERDRSARAKLSEFNNRIRTMMFDGVKTKPGRSFELELATLNQSSQAFEALVKWYNSNRNRGDEDLKNYSSFADRLHEHAIRLAATLAAFDQAEAIELSHALCAIDLMEFYIQERINLEIGVMVRDQERSQSASKMLAWIKSKNWTNTKNDLRRNGPGFFREMDTSQRDQILEDLLRDEELVMTEESVNGKVKQIFSLNTEESSK